MVDIAVIIVSWNTRDLTLEAIRSLHDDLQHEPDLTAEIWVVDNASSDGSPDAIATTFPLVKLIRHPENSGFAKANNIGMRAMGFGHSQSDSATLPRAVYLLNSDTITQRGATGALFRALMTRDQAGVVGARLSFGDGSFQHGAFEFPDLKQLWIDLLPAPSRLYDTRWNGRYPRALYAGETPFRVGHTLGATMMLRREVIEQTGMFDEQFFMYAEEVDWSWRIQKAGWNIYCVPTAHVIHLGGQSTKQVKPRSVLNLWESRLRLFKKHYPPYKRWLARRLIYVGMQRKIHQTHRQYQSGEISQEAHEALVEAYRQVTRLTI